MCLICGENEGYFDGGEPCWGCNFSICTKCGLSVPYNVPCPKCGTVIPMNKWGKYELPKA